MSSSLSFARVASACVVAAFTSTGAFAVPVAPGGAPVALPGTTVADDPSLAGTVIADKVVDWVSAIDPTYGFPGAEGSFQSRVVRETATGTLDFYWRVTVDGVSYPTYTPTSLTIGHLPLGNLLAGASYNADYSPDGPGNAAPSGAYAASADSLTYLFDASLGPAGSTYFLVLRSNATLFDDSAVASLGASALDTFAPTTTVVEPVNAGLLLSGLLAFGAMRRWQRRHRQA
jgi:hypothetical protein